MNIADLLKEKREEIIRVAEKHGARNVRLFGSAVRDEADDKSDVDFLVSFDPEASLLDHMALARELETLLGRKVDIVSDKAIYWILRRKVLKEARTL